MSRLQTMLELALKIENLYNQGLNYDLAYEKVIGIIKRRRGMKYTILGFQQSKLIELGLDIDDALILSVIRDLYSSKKMEHEVIDNDRFIWIDQSYLINQIPIVGSKRKLVRKIKKYVELGLIERRIKNIKYNLKAKSEADKKKKGTFSYINTTEKLEDLTEYETDEDIHEGCDKMAQRVRQNDLGGKTKCRNKDTSIKDTSIKDINIYTRIIDYLNKKVGTSYRAATKKTQQIINSRINEGFKEDDFYKVIDKKAAEWINDDKMCNYLRPETLFGTKFESYLNQKVGGFDGTNRVYGTRQNIKASGYNRNKGKSYFSKVKSEDELTDEERAARAELE